MKAQLEVLDSLFPKTRADILRLLFSGKKRQCYVRKLTILTGLALRTIRKSWPLMDAIGLVTSWSYGYHRFYRANRAHPLFANLCGIVQTSAHLSCPKLPPHRRRRLRS